MHTYSFGYLLHTWAALIQDALVLLSKCHLLNLSWDEALRLADKALNFNKKDVRAMIVKGEALFNVCQFEHAMVFFSRALVSEPSFLPAFF